MHTKRYKTIGGNTRTRAPPRCVAPPSKHYLTLGYAPTTQRRHASRPSCINANKSYTASTSINKRGSSHTNPHCGHASTDSNIRESPSREQKTEKIQKQHENNKPSPSKIPTHARRSKQYCKTETLPPRNEESQQRTILFGNGIKLTPREKAAWREGSGRSPDLGVSARSPVDRRCYPKEGAASQRASD